jgi:hypothetical protein
LTDLASLEAHCAEEGSASSRVLPLAKVLTRVRLRSALLFPVRPRIRKRRRVAVAALACVDALSALALAFGYLHGLEGEKNALAGAYLRMQRQNGAALRLSEEAEAKEKKFLELAADTPPDTYALIAGIATRLGEGTRILSLVLKDGSFEMEAEGGDALATLALLEGTSKLGGLVLRRSLAEKNGLERFFISGKFGDDRN